MAGIWAAMKTRASKMTMRVSLPLTLLASLALGACSGGLPGKASSVRGKGDSKSAVAGVIASAAADAASEGNTTDALAFQQKLYYADPRNPEYILSYARALRRAGKIDDALLVIRTSAGEKRAREPLKTEAAMVLISAGRYDEAMEFAQGALGKDGKSPAAHQALALAMSGLNKHAEAEEQFRQALKLWPENTDKTPVINNLAMSLAAQGKIAEAKNVMSMATGEALKSPIYQNNRAMLDSLKDHAILRAPIQPATTPARGGKARPPVIPGRMKPIIE